MRCAYCIKILYNALSVVLDNIVLFEYKTKEEGSVKYCNIRMWTIIISKY